MEDSNEWIPGGEAWQFQGYDENGLLRSLNGRLIGVNKMLCSAAEIACKGRQDFHLGHDGGYMIRIHSKSGQGMKIHFEKLVNWHGKNELIPVHLENNIFNFYLNREVKSTETNNVNDAEQCFAKKSQQWGNESGSALVSPTTNLKRDVPPIGDDIEPVGESRADVETGNEEEEESLEAEIPTVEMNPKNPRVELNKNMKIVNMLFTGIFVLRVSKLVVLGDNLKLNRWRKKEENKKNTPQR